ncbi:hypothetical protein BP00DRAFT_121792 [Aspergillus indologenus CBS 114.80]|uniref:Zn(2)-C6 fungal-type domain-containing protein n=1 Tax=Aspergillus indologenus CBS 114.80 TaxID=1450541 RepID=A0A2V5J6D1_9EURO|nr:hypothetical protein BP00DRAFT_121792 [Aspergillus indologenus CBS 114.80]
MRSCRKKCRKCDRTRPFCRRCQVKGLQCEGYPPRYIILEKPSLQRHQRVESPSLAQHPFRHVSTPEQVSTTGDNDILAISQPALLGAKSSKGSPPRRPRTRHQHPLIAGCGTSNLLPESLRRIHDTLDSTCNQSLLLYCM